MSTKESLYFLENNSIEMAYCFGKRSPGNAKRHHRASMPQISQKKKVCKIVKPSRIKFYNVLYVRILSIHFLNEVT
jgi:hypothetical protein